MKIYIEFVLIENFLLNLIILKTVSLFVKEKGRLFFLSALLGAIFTVALPILHLNAIGHFLTQIGLAILYVCLSFKFKTIKKFLVVYLAYFVSAFAYGGAVYFFESLIGQNYVLLVLAIVTLMFITIKFLQKRLERKKNIEAFCLQVNVSIDNKNISCKAFLDSGNLLTDPVTGQPVCLINFKMFSQLFENIKLEDVLKKDVRSLKFAHYINFSTLNNTDKILVFQVDKMSVADKTYEKPILGLSFKNFSQIFGTDMILNNSFA